MKNLETQECELKYEIEPTKISYFESLLIQHGAFFLTSQLEHDYVPDLKDFLCRKSGLLLRFRQITGRTNDILLTLKIKYQSTQIQHYGELQYQFSDVNAEIFQAINTQLMEKVGVDLPESIHQMNDLHGLQVILEKLGFTENRANIEKFRRMYQKGQIVFTIDTFPEEMGTFLEIEAPTQEELLFMTQLLALDESHLEKKDYGEIIRFKKQDLPENEQRVCLFTQEEREDYQKQVVD